MPPTTSAHTSTSIPLPAISEDLHARLAEDIRRRGCIVPVIVDAEGRVIDGRARIEICRCLGVIPKKIVVANLTAEERADWRLALNTYRRQLSRVQVRELIAWQLARAPHASDRSIASDVGVSHHTVGAVRAATGREVDHRLGRDGRLRRTGPTVVHTVSEGKARAVSQHLLSLGSQAPPGPQSTRQIQAAAFELERAKFLASLPSKPRTHKSLIVHHGDFRSAVIKPGSVDLVICDPPWAAHAKIGRVLGEAIRKALRTGGVAAVYTGPDNQVGWLDQLRSAGLSWVWTVILHHRNSERLVVHDLHNAYSPVLVFAHPGPRPRLASLLRDVIDSPEHEKQYHPWQQPIGPAEQLVRALSHPGAMIVDFTCGSGTSAVAVHRAGEGRRFQGWEIDADTVRVARARIAAECR